MDTQLFVTINVMALSAIAGVMLAARRDWNFVWSIAIHLSIFTLGAVALWLRWPNPGWLIGMPFLLFVVAPAALMFRSQRLAAAGNTPGALKYMRLATVIHPTPAMRFQARISEAQSLADPEERAAAFNAIAADTSPRNKRLAEAYAMQALDRWDRVLATTDIASAERPELAVLHLRALGECGRLADMVETYTQIRTSLPASERLVAELFVFAFTGREAAINALLDRRMTPYDAETKAFWKAVAARNAGKPDGTLRELAASAGRISTRLAAARHLAAAPRDAASELSPDANALLDSVAQRALRDAEFAAYPRKSATATLFLIACNAIMFAAELVHGGPEDLETLYALGALWPGSIEFDGEWWRLGSALFLHFGWTHFVVNMLSLFVLGRAVEMRLGTTRMLAVYLLGGLMSSAAVFIMMSAPTSEPGLLVGASGAIMALFGAIIAEQVVNWRRSNDVLDRRPLLALLALVVLQTVIDLSLPQISLMAHLAGLAAGFAVALPLIALRPNAQPSTA